MKLPQFFIFFFEKILFWVSCTKAVLIICDLGLYVSCYLLTPVFLIKTGMKLVQLKDVCGKTFFGKTFVLYSVSCFSCHVLHFLNIFAEAGKSLVDVLQNVK